MADTSSDKELSGSSSVSTDALLNALAALRQEQARTNQLLEQMLVPVRRIRDGCESLLTYVKHLAEACTATAPLLQECAAVLRNILSMLQRLAAETAAEGLLDAHATAASRGMQSAALACALTAIAVGLPYRWRACGVPLHHSGPTAWLWGAWQGWLASLLRESVSPGPAALQPPTSWIWDWGRLNPVASGRVNGGTAAGPGGGIAAWLPAQLGWSAGVSTGGNGGMLAAWTCRAGAVGGVLAGVLLLAAWAALGLLLPRLLPSAAAPSAGASSGRPRPSAASGASAPPPPLQRLGCMRLPLAAAATADLHGGASRGGACSPPAAFAPALGPAWPGPQHSGTGTSSCARPTSWQSAPWVAAASRLAPAMWTASGRQLLWHGPVLATAAALVVGSKAAAGAAVAAQLTWHALLPYAVCAAADAVSLPGPCGQGQGAPAGASEAEAACGPAKALRPGPWAAVAAAVPGAWLQWALAAVWLHAGPLAAGSLPLLPVNWMLAAVCRALAAAAVLAAGGWALATAAQHGGSSTETLLADRAANATTSAEPQTSGPPALQRAQAVGSDGRGGLASPGPGTPCAPPCTPEPRRLPAHAALAGAAGAGNLRASPLGTPSRAALGSAHALSPGLGAAGGASPGPRLPGIAGAGGSDGDPARLHPLFGTGSRPGSPQPSPRPGRRLPSPRGASVVEEPRRRRHVLW
ncbi:hypothetical protein HYH03_014302 [Edaphochlamys debaryana]|uniref:Uncharacterized protein n=1 Tax=Edaphochlamys debaryana TaxID=47281 RepID=A0A835XRS3_9CHLO|nr:hypothetical protein HYH03_014302 [Edaphochlamys debaryana]|eukprot:KAG2487056.1 hypothetical protein HYH03_014302 [Edaphochlamys debaryana]